MEKLRRIDSFKYRFDSAQAYIEYLIESNLNELKRNPKKPIQ